MMTIFYIRMGSSSEGVSTVRTQTQQPMIQSEYEELRDWLKQHAQAPVFRELCRVFEAFEETGQVGELCTLSYQQYCGYLQKHGRLKIKLSTFDKLQV
jgi:uncharacterized protein YozE (UPF0346 family)